MTDRTELQRLMDAATPRPWEWTTDLDALLGGEEGEYRVIDTAMALRSYYVLRVAAADAQLIAAAVNALPGLLDADENQDILIGSVNHYKAERDELATKLAHMTEARDNARAEVERLAALVGAVREACADVERDCVAGYYDPYEVRPAIESIAAILDGGEQS